jgi:hypothetical protein
VAVEIEINAEVDRVSTGTTPSRLPALHKDREVRDAGETVTDEGG